MSQADQLDPSVRPEDDEARVRAAAAVRRLGHAIVGHDVTPAELHAVADEIERRLPALEAGRARNRSVEIMKRNAFFAEPADGERIGTFPDCVVSGDWNPLGIGVAFYRHGDEAVADVTLGPAFEGAPNRAHGGIVAAIFDDLMGFVLHILSSPAFTGELTIRYLGPTPVGEEIRFRSWMRERSGRKIWIDAEAVHGGEVVATASGLFITIARERFGMVE